MPQRRVVVVVVGIESVDLIFLGRDEDDIVKRAVDGHARHVQRLGVNVTIYR